MITDYSLTKNWLKLPPHTDKLEHAADVFYLYSTSYDKLTEDDPLICPIDHQEMRREALYSYFKSGSVFQAHCNTFIPYYRQTDAPSCLSLPQKEKDELLKKGPVADATAAFDYYLKNYNNGRPYILAGHSQGSDVLLHVLSEYMSKNPEISKRMVAAYAIGYSVTPDYLADNPHLKFATGRSDTGVIISYNTEAPNCQTPNPVVLKDALNINPINWQRDDTHAANTESLGSRMPYHNFFQDVSQLADAQIDLQKNVLICSTLSGTPYDDTGIFPPGIYHSLDYTLYYYDLRQNCLDRINAYLKFT
jgi:hypothetical protein